MKEIGQYSGNKRLDTSNFIEPDNDTEDVRKKWLCGGREIRIKRKLRIWNERISPTGDLTELIVHMVGQSHLDCAWMWRYEQTRKKAQITFNKAIIHAKMFPKDFCFAISEPILLEWVKEDNPKLFKDIQKYVEKGNIELVGGSYVEADCMMPSGEAMIRQRLYGMRFYRDHFDQLPSIEWFLDSFGYNFGLPQILVKSGAKYFWTTKMGWNLGTTFPFVHFWWNGADGTKILTGQFHMDNSVFDTWQKFQIGRHLLKKDGRKTWNYALDYENLKNHVQEKICPHVGFFFGKSDGGHGPTHREIAYANEIAKLENFEWSRVESFFKAIEKYSSRFPIWNDELYLENHRGCFSNHADIKRFNRRFENELVSLESLAVITYFIFEDFKYPQEKLKRLWKNVLKNQFHDVLPGSSIPEVFDDVYDDWEFNIAEISSVYKEISEEFNKYKKINENRPHFTDFLLYNPHTWESKFRVFIPDFLIGSKKDQIIATITVLNSEQKIYAQKVSGDPDGLEDRLSKGWWAVVNLKPLSLTPIRFTLESDFNDSLSQFSISKRKISNEKVSLFLNPENGAILKLLAKDINNEKNLLKGKSSNLTFGYLDDDKRQPAWNLTPEYWKYPLNFANNKNIEINIDEIGPVFATIEIRKRIGISQVIQKIRLFTGLPDIYFEYYTDWKQEKVMLKVLYSTSTNANEVNADGMYCSISSKTDPKVPCDKARYEKICQEYFDLSTPDNSWGLALINEGKYAFDVNNDDMRLTLLRSCKYPSPAPEAWVNEERKFNQEKYNHEVPKFSGLGPFICRYSILAHNGGTLVKKDGTPNSVVKQKSREFNMPISVIPLNGIDNRSTLHLGDLINIHPSNVFLGSLKFNEWKENGSVIIRFYEAMGMSADVKIIFDSLITKKLISVNPVDLIERSAQFDYTWSSEGILKFKLNKFEICTFELTLEN